MENQEKLFTEAQVEECRASHAKWFLMFLFA